jgi:hypothetical protein
MIGKIITLFVYDAKNYLKRRRLANKQRRNIENMSSLDR